MSSCKLVYKLITNMALSIPPKTNSNRSKVWFYFKQCDGDPNKVKCNLCAVELCNSGTTTILWNHVRFKHSIYKTTPNEEEQEWNLESNMTSNIKLKNNSKNLKQLDFIDYNDLSATSMKPSPSSSISRDFISRLNQLSSPVTRKLKFWNKKSFQVNQYDPSFKVIYLGNLGMQLWSKDESCLDKPLGTLWNNYLVNMKTEIIMRLTICNSGLKAITRQHGLTQYWSNRLVYCCSHKNYPRIFSWIYRHEGKKMRQELRCHAVLCPSPEKATKMVTLLSQRLACALQEFRREKKSRGFSNVGELTSMQQRMPRTIPLRRQILAKGSANFRPPLERSKSAPKLTSILEEDYDLDDEASDEEYEYDESIDDREDSDYEEEDSARDDEGSTQKFESNSLSTTVNEESSNNSVYIASDSLTDGRGRLSKSNTNEHSNGIVDQKDINRFAAGFIDIADIKEFRTTETFECSYNELNSHKSLQLSANIENNSSSCKEPSLVSQDVKLKDSSQATVNKAKNNNVKSKEDLQTEDLDEDTATQQIILSWSNLVIK